MKILKLLIIGLVLTACMPQPFIDECAVVVEGAVNCSGDVGKYTSIALDSGGSPHISYYNADDRDLRYAKKDSNGRWWIEEIPKSHGGGLYTSIALDSNDKIHISHYDAINKDLEYVTGNTGSWAPYTVDATGDVGLYTSIALDWIDNPYISYYDEGNGYLKLAFKEAGQWRYEWRYETLSPSVNLQGESTAIVIHPMNSTPIIAFFDFNGRALKLALFDRENSDWGTELVVSTDGSIQHIDMVLHPSGGPRISYSEVLATGTRLMYAKKDCDTMGCLTDVTQTQPTGKGNWNIEEVDNSSGGSYEFTSIALDSNGNPHISYHDAIQGTLKYASKSENGWTTQTLDSSPGVGEYTSLAIDASDKVHISYRDSTNGDLKYYDP